MRKSLVTLWSLFLAACEATISSPAATPEEQAAWTAARAADTVDSYRSFLRQFPQGAYAQEAARELQSEEQELAQVTPLPAPGRNDDPRPAY